MNQTESIEDVLDMVMEDSMPSNATSSYGFSINPHEFFILSARTVALICNVLIIYIITANPRMQTRRNVILRHWAIFDALDYPILMEFIAYISEKLMPPSSAHDYFDVCLISFSQALFKFNCIFLMVLMVSTTVMRMQFITDAKFKWCLYTVSIFVYICNFCVCYFVSYFLIFVKYLFLFSLLFVVVLAKEINVCLKTYMQEPIRPSSRIKMNIVRIYTYNYMVVFFGYIILLHYINYNYIVFVALEVMMHIVPVHILIYLYNADENFTAGLRKCFQFCCRKQQNNQTEATVRYSNNEEGHEVSFQRM